MSRHQQQMNQAVQSLRQSAVVASSAANSACRVAGQSNPTRMLRLWTAEATTKRLMAPAVRYVKGQGK